MKIDNKKGIVIAVPKKYEKICLENILNIRKSNGSLPIEIWEIGQEISPNIRKKLTEIENITFKNVDDYCNNSKHWKGFQIKAFILFHSEFEETMLCDADVIIHQNPNVLFEDENYIKTGAYFFKDLEKWQFSKLNNKWEQIKQRIFYNKFTSASFFLKRKKWLTSLLPKKSSLFPPEWNYMYEKSIPRETVKEALQESGVVLINKNIHKESIEHIYNLNNNHKNTYKYVWGDKETFWIGCVMANKAFYFNPTSGYMSNRTNKLTHNYKDKVFFSQKG